MFVIKTPHPLGGRPFRTLRAALRMAYAFGLPLWAVRYTRKGGTA